MKNFRPIPWMLFVVLIGLAPIGIRAQSETHNFITYDTVLQFSGGGQPTWTVRISRPANMFTPNHPDTASRPAIIFMPGTGEVGTDPNNLTVYGPHYWIKNGWDGGVQLGNGKHYPVIISIVVSTSNVRPWYTKQLIDTLRHRYHIKWNSMHFTGLSMGGWTWGRMLTYSADGTETSAMGMMRSFVSLEGNAADNFNTVSFGTTAYRKWVQLYDGRYFALEGTNDTRNLWIQRDSMVNAGSTKAFFSYQKIGGGVHCCWNDMYNPSANDWWSVAPVTNANIGINTNHPNSTGDYQKGTNIFQWMLQQGDTSLVGAQPPVVSAGTNIVLLFPASSTQLSGSASDPNSPITGYSWTKLSGPAATIVNGNTLTPTVNSMTIGIYTFQLTATNALGASANSQVQVLLTTTLPIEFGNFTAQAGKGVDLLSWDASADDGLYDIERSVDGNTFSSIAQIPAEAGNGSTHDYTYTDRTPLSGSNFYRIRNTAASGLIKYSKTVEVKQEEAALQFSVFPNPVRDMLNVRIIAKQTGNARIRLLSLDGRVVQQHDGFKTESNYNDQLNLSSAAPGIYLVEVSIGNSFHELAKIVNTH